MFEIENEIFYFITVMIINVSKFSNHNNRSIYRKKYQLSIYQFLQLSFYFNVTLVRFHIISMKLYNK